MTSLLLAGSFEKEGSAAGRQGSRQTEHKEENLFKSSNKMRSTNYKIEQ